MYVASAALPPFKPSEGSELWASRTSAVKHKAALELTRQGETRLRTGDANQALSFFEKALGLEASPYVYISIARAHYILGHYSESLSFIDVAESWLKQQSDSVPELTAFKARVPGSGLTEQIFPENREAAGPCDPPAPASQSAVTVRRMFGARRKPLDGGRDH